MFYRLVLLFTLLPLIELYLLYLLSTLLGWTLTIIIVLLTGFWGAFMAKLQGWFLWRDVRVQMMRGKMPADSLFDGVIILVASVMLITPGVLTDLAGFLLLVPPIRVVVRNFAKAYLSQRMILEVRNMTFGPNGTPNPTGQSGPARPTSPDVIDVEFTRKPN